MMESSVFDNLVTQLSPAERQALLAKLKAKKEDPEEAHPPSETPLPANWQITFQGFGWFRKLILYLKVLFTGAKMQQLVEDKMMQDLGHELDRRMPGMINSRIRMVYGPFYDELRLLFEGLKVFRKPMMAAFGPNKGDFFAFFVGMEMPDVQQRLLDETDHWKIYEQNPDRPNKEIKAIVDANLRLILDGIPAGGKKILFEGVKSLFSLKQLATLNEEKLLSPFQVMTFGGSAGTVVLDELKAGLIDLWERLLSFDVPPPLTVLESLFLFSTGLSNPDGKPDQAGAEQMIKSAQDAFGRIRDFRKSIPLGRLVAFATRDLALQPRSTGGIEDWFQIYKSFWRNRVDGRFDEFSKERNTKVLLQEAASFLDLTVEEFNAETIYPPYYSGHVPTPKEKAFKFFKLFWQKIFIPKVNPILRAILLDGDFYKKQNKMAFTENYNFVLKVQEKITAFQKGFANDGEWGKLLTEARGLREETQVFQKVKEIYLQAGDWVDLMLKDSLYNLGTFQGQMEGLLKGEQGGKVEVLSNMANLGGRTGNFRKEMEGVYHRWEKFLRILNDLYLIE